MGVCRIAVIGESERKDGMYAYSKNYFLEKFANDKENHVEFYDVTNMSEEEMRVAGPFHLIMYDTQIHNTKHVKALATLASHALHRGNFKVLPISRDPVTQKTNDMETDNLNKLLDNCLPQDNKEEPKIRAVISNISSQADRKSYLEGIVYSSIIGHLDSTNSIMSSIEYQRKLLLESTMNAMAKKDTYTLGHFERVGKYCEVIAQKLGWPTTAINNTIEKAGYDIATQEEIPTIEGAKLVGYLHDMGKLGIQNKILKNRHLTTQGERGQMAPHNELATSKDDETLSLFERTGIELHHTPYWKQVEDGNVNQYACLVMVADVLDAMSSQRDYNNPKNIMAALRELYRCSRPGPNQQFEQQIAETCILMLGQELSSMGFDCIALVQEMQKIEKEEMIKRGKNPDEYFYHETDSGLSKIFSEHQEELAVNTNAKEGEYSKLLGIAVSPTLHMEHEDNKIDQNTRIRSEYEFSTSKAKEVQETQQRGKSIKKFEDMEYLVPTDKRKELLASAIKTVNKQDELGRRLYQASFKGISREKLAQQIKEAAENDPQYTSNNAKEASKTILDGTKNPSQQKRAQKENPHDKY